MGQHIIKKFNQNALSYQRTLGTGLSEPQERFGHGGEEKNIRLCKEVKTCTRLLTSALCYT